MPVMSLSDWITEFAAPENLWFVKRLAGNDTLATKSHQAGPYIPKPVAFAAVPTLQSITEPNPTVPIEAFVDSHPDRRMVNIKWYNKVVSEARPRDETRITRWGGMASALRDPDSTGALAVFVFVGAATGAGASSLHVWVCQGRESGGFEDEVIEDRVGPVEPGRGIIWRPGEPPAADLFSYLPAAPAACRLTPAQMPESWRAAFPTAQAIVRKAVELRPLQSEEPDERLLRRRECEFEIFRSVEEMFEGQRIADGFASVDEFVERALSILQRRKARSGLSLELHAREILLEEGFKEGLDFSHSPVSENGKRPDFLFPSQAAYQDGSFPRERLRMLAAKTTLKDRWRQILNEAHDIPRKHLLTLQEGVSVNQFAEMEAASVQLVVPRRLLKKYPKDIRPKLMTVQDFFTEIRELAVHP